ncbi:hypothetical protein PybrP1_004855 [[Pythium] brassicae (nom. inval.)]|nr:hypothetical protein PybrP1_004855 [[Pythium] brassicae (nom. inval.)]
MAPSSLLLSSRQKPHATPSQDSSVRDEKLEACSDHREWAPSQIIRLQRIERQERESFAKLRASEQSIRDTILAALADASSSNEGGRAVTPAVDSHDDNTTSEAETVDGDVAESEVQDFDVDEIFHLSPATCPNMRGPAPSTRPTLAASPASPPASRDARRSVCSPCVLEHQHGAARATAPEHDNDNPAALKLKIFTGTWNMAARDPFADKKEQYVGDEQAASDLAGFLPLGYDLYVIGTQEKVASAHFHTAMLARLHAASSANASGSTASSPAYVRLDLSAPTHSNRPGSSSGARAAQSRGNNDSFRDSVLRASSFDLVSSGAEVATSANGLTPQSPTFGSTVALEPPKSHHRRQQRARDSGHEVRGRGDGAFLHAKATSMAIYAAAHLAPAIEVVRTGAHKFSFSSGSKGGIAVMLRVAGCEQTVTFVNCHLEANRPALRRQQLETLTKKLPLAMGFREHDTDKKSAPPDLAACSDHVVWMGDFNYRIHSLDGETVLRLLASHRHMELHDRYDSMKDDMAIVGGMQRFCEPRKWPSFYPTYKKLPDRSADSGVLADSESDPDWPLRVYRVRYREPFYKGGRVKARVPGWCDRILLCSSPAWRSCLEVERVPCTLRDHPLSEAPSDRSEAASEQSELRDNYRSVNDSLRGSDHSPVFCTFCWTVRSGE